NNQDGKRPESIKVQLLADGKASGDPVVLNDANKWSYTWSGLDAKKAGKDISYSVEEVEVPAGYEVSVTGDVVTGYTITNTHETETTDVNGTKTWNDSNNQDGIRPENITVNLLADGQKIDSQTVTAENGWNYSFTNLPKFRDGGTEIVYTVSEDAVAGYTLTTSGTNLINTHQNGKTSISVAKVWKDSNNQDGKRPESIEVQLLADGKASGDPVELNDTNKWSYTWSDLDAKKAGKEISYSVEEVKVPEGYEVSVTGDAATGYTITNTHNTETTEVTGTKTWNDSDNQDGVRPDSITVRLLADGEEVDHKSVTEEDGWTYSFTNLPKYADGKEIVYTITEDAVADYKTEVKGTDLINTHENGKTSISVVKVWNDNNNQDGKRPESIEVQLMADEKASGDPVVLNEDNKWSYTWSDLDAKKAGKAISYSVEEVKVPDGYTVSYSGDAITGYTITNTHETEKTTVNGKKTWHDLFNRDKIRPESITVRLLADGKEVDYKTVTAEDDWKYSFENLDKYADGEEIEYTITEDPVEDYTTEVKGYDLSNKENEYASVSVNVGAVKILEGKDLTEGQFKFELLAEDKNTVMQTVTNAADGTVAFEPLEYKLEDLGGEKTKTFTYYIREVNDEQDGITYDDNVEEITVTLRKTLFHKLDAKADKEAKDIVFTNKFETAVAKISGTKEIENGKPEEGRYRFELVDETGRVVDTATNNADGSFAFKTRLYDEAGTYNYTIREVHEGDTIDGIEYTAGEVNIAIEVKADEQTHLFKPVIKTVAMQNKALTDITVDKIWDDTEDAAGDRPDHIDVHLFRDGEKVADGQITAASGWVYTFANLETRDADGKAYTYTVTEDQVPNYISDVTYGYQDGNATVKLVNTRLAKVDIYANKTLTGAALTEGQFTFELYHGDTKLATAQNSASGQIVFAGVDYYEDGYTVKEVAGNDTHIVYDGETYQISMKDGQQVEEPTFKNIYRPIVLRVQKRSRDANSNNPLYNAVYALYRVDGGNAMKVEEQTSDVNGYMYFRNIEPGHRYYFKEVSAPEGHTVDPYATNQFEVKWNEGASGDEDAMTIVSYGEDGQTVVASDGFKISDTVDAPVAVREGMTELTDTADASTFVYEGNGIKAVAKTSIEDPNLQGATLVVNKLSKDSEKFKAAAAAIEDANGQVTPTALYDISFQKDGAEVEPDAGDTVTVTLQNAAGLGESADVSAVRIVHVTDTGNVDLLNGTVGTNGNTIQEVTLTSSTFSTFGLAEATGETTALENNLMVTAQGVADKVTNLNVQKLDKDSLKPIAGAHLQILEKATGSVVQDWTSGQTGTSFYRSLNVNTEYILHEVSAPDGYDVAPDVVFTIDDYGYITLVSGSDNAMTSRDAEADTIDSSTLSLLDKKLTVFTTKQRTVTEHKGRVVTVSSNIVKSVQTGDTTQIALMIILLVAAGAALAALLAAKKRGSKK
ncbi:MAG: Cna B-type domain-containing protein, partial [Eubacterium sp.]|nr:Cna B-type domain-containing protein [Eubacterium sp.]